MKSESTIWFVIDDREQTSLDVSSLVGNRCYGDIVIKRQSLFERLRELIPIWAKRRTVRLQSVEDLRALRTKLEAEGPDAAVCVIAGRAGVQSAQRLRHLFERMPYAEENFTDTLYNPLLVFIRDVHSIIGQWKDLEVAPLHQWPRAWQDAQRVEASELIDLSDLRGFLSFSCGATATRHFNEMRVDAYYYTKRSTDKRKMRAEYAFYGLVPESMRPWLIQPFDFRDEGSHASYRMLRYYLADASLQWVHGAFRPDTFAALAAKLLFFIQERPRRAASPLEAVEFGRQIFLRKVRDRVAQFLQQAEGAKIDALIRNTSPSLGVERQLERFSLLFDRYEKGFQSDHLVVGHGDPCFSNVLYDQHRYLLTLIDPKGAVTEDELWTHPLYDLCKISHSILGDYDFINNGFYSVDFTDTNELLLSLRHEGLSDFKQEFIRQIRALGIDYRILRLGEASLFLSMLPMHIDVPNKVLAFMLKASEILDEVENG